MQLSIAKHCLAGYIYLVLFVGMRYKVEPNYYLASTRSVQGAQILIDLLFFCVGVIISSSIACNIVGGTKRNKNANEYEIKYVIKQKLPNNYRQNIYKKNRHKKIFENLN